MKNKEYRKVYIERSLKLPVLYCLERFEFGTSVFKVDYSCKSKQYKSLNHKLKPYFRHNLVMKQWGSRGWGFKKIYGFDFLDRYHRYSV